jgi:hypothetical protein
MVAASDFTTELEAKVAQQLKSQRVGYLLGAGSSYLDGRIKVSGAIFHRSYL